MARRAGALEQRLGLGVGEERRHFLRDVGPRERLDGRSESLCQPVEQNRPVRGRERHVHPAMLRRHERVPPGAIERRVRVVVDAVARRAVLEDHTSRRAFRRRDLRARGPAGDLRRHGRRTQHCAERHDDRRRRSHAGRSHRHGLTPSPADAAGRCSSRSCPARSRTSAACSTACSRCAACCRGTRGDGCP